jgi:hypothetical protein
VPVVLPGADLVAAAPGRAVPGRQFQTGHSAFSSLSLQTGLDPDALAMGPFVRRTAKSWNESP